MFRFVTGNILESNADCLVNTVNCEGFMGKGIAYQFKARFPENNSDYVKACKSGILKIGTIHHFYEDGKLIVNLPTKNKWRESSKIDYIKIGLDELSKLIKAEKIKSIAIPPLGCGNGGLSWHEVKPIIVNSLKEFEPYVEVYLYEPSNYYAPKTVKAPKLNTSHLVLMSFKPHLKKFSKFRLQKTAFFLNLFIGEPYFKFENQRFGPYAHSIDILSKDIKEFQLYYRVDSMKAFEIAKTALISNSVEKRLEDFSKGIYQSTLFVNSIRTDKELELVSSICSLLNLSKALEEDKIIDGIKSWSVEKANKFNDKVILAGIARLKKEKLIDIDLVGHYKLDAIGLSRFGSSPAGNELKV